MRREERGGDGCPGDGMKSLRPLRPECQKWPEEIVLGRQRELALLFPANDASLDTGPTSGGGDRSSYDGNSYDIQNLANRKKMHQEIATFWQTGGSYNEGLF